MVKNKAQHLFKISLNKSDVKQQNGDVILGADLSADDSDPTEKVLGTVVTPLKAIPLLVEKYILRKSPSVFVAFVNTYPLPAVVRSEDCTEPLITWASSIADNGFLWVDYTKLDVEFIKLS